MRTTLALAAATAALLAAAPAAAHAAAPAVQFTRIQYDSPGKDTRSNAHLNGEWLQLTNTTRAAISLRGWTVRDAAGHTYTFGAVTLGAGRRITLHTGKGAASGEHRYWGSGTYVWNNDKDTATLRNASGKAIDSCRWTRPGSGSTSC